MGIGNTREDMDWVEIISSRKKSSHAHKIFNLSIPVRR